MTRTRPSWQGILKEARIIAKSGKYPQALLLIRKALRLYRGEYGFYRCAITYHDIKFPYKALEMCKEGIRVYPDSTHLRFQLAETLADLGYPTRAERVYREIIAIDPKDADAYWYLYWLLDENHHTKAAQEVLAAGLDDNPDDEDLLGLI